jgi:type II secretory pathway pseudopilin PulG
MSPRNISARAASGALSKSGAAAITAIEMTALVLSLVWLIGAALFLMFFAAGGAGSGALNFVVILLAVFMPVALIWVGAIVARSSRVMREESQRLQAAIDAIRQAYLTQNQALAPVVDKTVSQKLDEIAAAQRKTETALATFSSVRVGQPEPRPVLPPRPAPDEVEAQVSLPLGTPVEEWTPPLERADFIRAINFPEHPEDKAGFAALRRALKDRSTAQFIRAAQDVLTLLSQDGIYMDDLRPDMARPEIWRRFAAGERGRAVAALGGIRDRSSLALTAARMKQDTIFRDAAHHFLRLFDRMFAQFAESATDAEISDLSETRTARAFMLLGRVAGTFD